MGILTEIREFFWPLLEKAEMPELFPINKKDIVTTEQEHLKHVLEQTLKRYESEEDRKKTVESKAAQFIGTTSILIAIVLGMTSSFLSKQTEYNLSVSLMIFLLFILTLYITRTIWFSIQALERRSYQSLSACDFYKTSSQSYYQDLIVKIHNTTRSNYKAVNSKVDGMTLAHEYFKRALVTVCVYSFVMLLFFISKSDFGLDIITKTSSVDMELMNYIFLYAIALTALILAIRANRKRNRKTTDNK